MNKWSNEPFGDLLALNLWVNILYDIAILTCSFWTYLDRIKRSKFIKHFYDLNMNLSKFRCELVTY